MAIYCIGDIRADVFIHMKDYIVSSSSVSLGGTVANFSVVSTKLGQDVKLVGTAAKDVVGDYLVNELSGYGIDMSYVTRTRAGMNNILMALNNGNLLGYRMMEVPGVRYDGLGDIDYSVIHPGKGDFVHTSGGCIPEDDDGTRYLVDFLKRAKLNGACVSYDLNLRLGDFGTSEKRMAFIKEIAATADILMGAKDEFQALASEDDYRAAAGKFAQDGKTVICRNETDDVLYIEGEKSGSIPVNPVIVINPNGAGDTFDAAFIYAKGKGYPVEKCVSFASYVAGYMISSPVPRDVPAIEKCMEYLDS